MFSFGGINLRNFDRLVLKSYRNPTCSQKICQRNWLVTIPLAAVAESVPEPTAVVLLLLGLAGIVCRRR